MKFFHFSLSLTISLILLISVFCFFKSSLMLSIQVFRCLPLLLSPSTWPRRAAFAILFSSILSTYPNQLSLLFRMSAITQGKIIIIIIILFFKKSACNRTAVDNYKFIRNTANWHDTQVSYSWFGNPPTPACVGLLVILTTQLDQHR